MNNFSIIKLLLIKITIITALNVESIPNFCSEKTKIDAITKLSNGSLFLTSGRFYWTLNKNKQGFYENPTYDNVGGNIKSLFTETERIDSMETFSNRIGMTDEICGKEVDLLMIYWVISFEKMNLNFSLILKSKNMFSSIEEQENRI